MPGLIDSHVHLATDPSTTDPRDVIERRLKQALYGGVTSVRDMAGDARMLADLARAAMVHEIESPAIYYAALWAGAEFFTDPRTVAMSRGFAAGSVPWGLAIADSTNLALAVARAKGTGATAIKTYALLPAPLIERIADEAHRQGMKVWSHARVTPASPAQVIAARIDAVSHADMFVCVVNACTQAPTAAVYQRESATAPRLLTLYEDMKRRGVILDPTLFVYEVLGKAPGITAEQRLRLDARGAFGAAVTAAAHRAGVEIVAGTDSIGDGDINKYPNVHAEMELLVRNAGMTPLAAMRAATYAGAKAIGIEKTHGSVEIGKAADLVVLDADPALDIRNTRSVRYVIRNGRLYTRSPQ